MKSESPTAFVGPVLAVIAVLLSVPVIGQAFGWTLFSSSGFMPHGHCFLWKPSLLWLHVTSDLVIGLSYVAISATLGWLVYRARADMPFHWMILAFGLFIIACGGTHFVEIWTLWHPAYWFAGDVKVITAIASVTTAIALPPLVPRALDMIHAAETSQQHQRALEAANRELQRENQERLRIEQELLKSRAELREYIDQMSTMNSKVALDGTFLTVNRIGAMASGLTREELMRTNFLDGGWWTHDPEVKARVDAAFARAVAGEPQVYEERLFAFGREVPIIFTLMPVKDAEGKVAYLIAEARDITSQKEEEEALRLRTVELESANKELEAFSYSVSHDLRAPLRAIDGFSSILLDDHAAQLDPETVRHLSRIRENAQQMGRLIHDLLAFSRMGRQAMERQTVDVSGVVAAAVADLNGEATDRKVEIVIGELSPADADRALLKQVYLNLISNALKYTRLSEAARIEIGERVNDADGERTYYVRDNGVGFDMQYSNRLFGVFHRLHRAEDFEGTGVGLAIVQRIVYRHGGRVWAEAEIGRGATFYFTLGGRR
jgi:PAS domain S-box-containing protein